MANGIRCRFSGQRTLPLKPPSSYTCDNAKYEADDDDDDSNDDDSDGAV